MPSAGPHPHRDVRRYGLDDPQLDATVDEGQLWLDRRILMPCRRHPAARSPHARQRAGRRAGGFPGGASREAIADAARGFGGVPHRLETVVERAGIRWVNDSQATIPLAAVAGLEAFAPAPVVLIAGGRGKGLDYGELAETIVRARSGGGADRRVGRRAGGAGGRPRAAGVPGAWTRPCAWPLSWPQPGDVVLLSPAAASFDMFADYAARGDAFRAAVAALDGGAA